LVRYRYEVTARSAAAPDAVFAVLADGPGWSRWAGPMVRFSAWEAGGPEPPGGPGSVRLLGTRAFHSREEIVESRPPELLAYEVRSGWPVKDYRADVRLEPDGPGTLITWTGSFDALVPGTGGLVLALTRPMIAGFARRLATAAGGDGPRPA
jgi:uncharacterized protein YndB with AHSA1/START domain